MKVILNQDVKHLGEEGDVKDVAGGYARNYLFPKNYAVPFNAMTQEYFESKKEEIESRKVAKRSAAASLKEKLEATNISLAMPAGPNGKLYGAVTNQTISDELTKLGFDIERKKIEIPGLTIKSVGNYHANIRLYEAAVAKVVISVKATEEKKATTEKPAAKEEKAVSEKAESVAEETVTETNKAE